MKQLFNIRIEDCSIKIIFCDIKLNIGLKGIIQIFTYLLDSLCIIKNKKKIVFSSFPDFSDNAKEYYEYLRLNHPNEYELIWIYQNKESSKYEHIDKKYFINSIQGIYHLITSKYITCTWFYLHKYCNFSKHKLLQLWHGMPLKTLGYNEKNISTKTFIQYKIFGKHGQFFVTSDIFKLSMIASFLMHPNQIHITGQPKSDCILQKRNETIIKDFIGAEKYDKIIIYAPTYKEIKRNKRRDIDKSFNNIFYMDDYCEKSFLKILEKNNILLLIKPHPFEEDFYKDFVEEKFKNVQNIKVIYDADLKEKNLYFYDFFHLVDLLISDFSSIAIDFLILNKPVLFLDTLSKEYSKNRGFVLEDNYEMLMPGPKISNFNQFNDALNDALTIDSWAEKRLKILPLLHKYTDGKSCERIYEIMINM